MGNRHKMRDSRELILDFLFRDSIEQNMFEVTHAMNLETFVS